MKRLLGALALVLGAAAAASAGNAFGSKADFTLSRMFNAHGNFGFFRSATDPFTCTSNAEDQGSVYFNTTTGLTRVCVNGSWQSVGGGGSGITPNACAANQFVTATTSSSGTLSCSAVTEPTFSFTDVTTANASASAHGLLPKLSGSASQYLNGAGAWTTPSAGSLFTSRVDFGSAQDAANAIAIQETTGCITFEGSSADANETRLCVNNPVADETFNLPNTIAGTGTIMMSDMSTTFSGAALNFANTVNATFGDNGITGRTGMTPATSFLYTGPLSNAWHIAEGGDLGFNLQNGACGATTCTDPALIIHSHNQSTTQYVSIQHDGTNAQFKTGNDGQFTFNSGLTINNDAITQVATTINTSTNDGLKILNSTPVQRASVYTRNSASSGFSGIFADSDVASVGAYGGFFQFNSAASGTVAGVNKAGTVVVLSDGSSSNGMLIDVATNDPMVFGTNDIERLRLTGAGSLNLQRTVTAAGTTGAQTIDKMAGTVNFAASASTLVVTDALVSSTSIVFCTRRTNDSTCFIASCESGSGSFTIRMTATCTAETSVGFLVTN